MSTVRPESLTDSEFAELLYKSLGQTTPLPPEIQKEMLYRFTHGGRDAQRQANANDPHQMNLF